MAKITFYRGQTGFAHLILIIVIVVIVLGVLGYFGWRALSDTNGQSNSGSSVSLSGSEAEVPAELIWQQSENGWRSMSTPPDCPAQPMMKAPVDMDKVTSILYPGQSRGGNYKPHGGFRFDNSKNTDITVTAPIDGFIVRGGSYLDGGEIQYMFDIINNCGVMYRLDHIQELPESLQQLADGWPAATTDSRTQNVDPAIYVKTGEVLGTSVGIIGNENVAFDWGVYDYREPNEASTSVEYQQLHLQEKELAWYAVCWFDWLPSADATKIQSLPAGDPGAGKTSDYCK